MSVIGNILNSTPVNWLHKFIHFLKLDNFVHNTSNSDIDLSSAATNESLLQSLSSSYWSVGSNIELDKDILEWINNNIEELTGDGTIEVNTIQGDALCEFIKENQQNGKYKEISQLVLSSLAKSVIIVALDECGNITDVQMIRSKEGLSVQSLAQFKGQPILKIKIQS